MSDIRDQGQIPGWIDAEACRIVGVFLDDEALAAELNDCMPVSDAEFESLLADRRRELIAEGASGEAVAYRIAVMCHTRDALILRAELRALPHAREDCTRGQGRRLPWRMRFDRDA